MGCMDGHPQAKTPHMDGLVARGTLFSLALLLDQRLELFVGLHMEGVLFFEERAPLFVVLEILAITLRHLQTDAIVVRELLEHLLIPITFKHGADQRKVRVELRRGEGGNFLKYLSWGWRLFTEGAPAKGNENEA